MQKMQTIETAQSKRRYPLHPMVGVGAIVFRGDEVLLVKRGRQPGINKWSVPGGLVEVGEPLKTAIEREVLEETGIKVRAQDIIAVFDRIILDSDGNVEYHYVLIDFICEPLSNNDPICGDDSTASKYVKISSLSNLDLTEGTHEVINKAFSKERYPVLLP